MVHQGPRTSSAIGPTDPFRCVYLTTFDIQYTGKSFNFLGDHDSSIDLYDRL